MLPAPKVSKTTLVISERGKGSSIFVMDTIEHDGRHWLVPSWVDDRSRGTTKPTRMVALDAFQHQTTNEGFVINAPVPSFVFDQPLPKELQSQYTVIEAPTIEFRRAN